MKTKLKQLKQSVLRRARDKLRFHARAHFAGVKLQKANELLDKAGF